MRPESIWDGTAAGARVARGLLTPASWVYCGVMAARNAWFDHGSLSVHPTAIPTLSVGNLSVGGTGKTPVAADIAARLHAMGGSPAIVLRGYGDDEARVHGLLNPDVPILTNADRVAACADAWRLGCDVAVLDDAFQHRRAARVVDVVLVAAEQWQRPMRCLPAGRYRELPVALRRATLAVVTRKAASAQAAASVAEQIARVVSHDSATRIAQVAFILDALHRVGGDSESRELETVRGTRVVAVAGIGAPHAFAAQLSAAGAEVELVSFPDHHEFSASDVASILRRAAADTSVVCTLKDAVKLERLWPRAATALWYVSQRLAIEAGHADYTAALQRVLAARP